VRRGISLIVDDDRSVRMFVRAVLEREQFETLEADGGNSAWRIVKGLAGALDLIVSDLQMPNGGGLAFAAAVRKQYPAIPILLMSGYVDGITDFAFLPKPFTWTELASAVERVVASPAAPR